MNFWLKYFRKDPWQAGIMAFVIGAHILFLTIVMISPASHFHKKERKKLIVKTVAAKPPPPKVSAQIKSVKPSSHQHVAFPKPAQKPAPKKETPNPAPVQKEAPPKPKQPAAKKEIATAPEKKPAAKKEIAAPPEKKPAVKKEPAIADKKLGDLKQPPKKNPPKPPERAKISDSLLKELEESIAKIEKSGDKGTAKPKKTLASPAPLQIDTPLAEAADAEEDYTDALIGHLHQCLTLPDYGEVKIQLSLRQDGTVIKLVVLRAQSEKNKQYLEKNLPQLRFPRFDGAYASKKECVFTFTFCNE